MAPSHSGISAPGRASGACRGSSAEPPTCFPRTEGASSFVAASPATPPSRLPAARAIACTGGANDPHARSVLHFNPPTQCFRLAKTQLPPPARAVSRVQWRARRTNGPAGCTRSASVHWGSAPSVRGPGFGRTGIASAAWGRRPDLRVPLRAAPLPRGRARPDPGRALRSAGGAGVGAVLAIGW